MHRLVLLLVGVLALAACGSGAGASTADVEGQWHLRSGTADGGALPQPPGARATLELTGDEARGTSFCNHWFATVQLNGSACSLDGIGQTEMACEPEVMAAESAYLAALATVDTVAVDGEELVLTGDDVELRFGPVPAVPDSPLAGTRWVLESLVDGETASSVLGEATLQLNGDGTATGSTACTTWSGTWQRDGDSLVLAARVMTDQPCAPEFATYDTHALAVTSAQPDLVISGNRLTLTADDGRGLVYRGEG